MTYCVCVWNVDVQTCIVGEFTDDRGKCQFATLFIELAMHIIMCMCVVLQPSPLMEHYGQAA